MALRETSFPSMWTTRIRQDHDTDGYAEEVDRYGDGVH